MMKRRISDYLRVSVLLGGILALSLSWVVVLYAQSNSSAETNERFKAIETQQRTDEEKVNSIDKRLLVIETKQDFITYLIYGLGVGIGTLLLERFRGVFVASRRRQDNEEN